MTVASLLDCRGVCCGYQGHAVLRDVDLSVHAGEVLVLLGPNGSGKSTLLKSIIRELPLIGGSIALGDASITTLSVGEIAKRIAVVPQEESPAFEFTVRETVTLGRLARSTSFSDSEEDVQEATKAMSRADCLAFQDRAITQLSGGERQRVLIARALAQGTDLLLLDEPTSHLDPLHQMKVVQLVRSLAAEGKGIVAAVHDLNLAAEIADRALLLGPGGVMLCSEVSDVLGSQKLEEAYGVRFERLHSESGRIFVRPRQELNLHA